MSLVTGVSNHLLSMLPVAFFQAWSSLARQGKSWLHSLPDVVDAETQLKQSAKGDQPTLNGGLLAKRERPSPTCLHGEDVSTSEPSSVTARMSIAIGSY